MFERPACAEVTIPKVLLFRSVDGEFTVAQAKPAMRNAGIEVREVPAMAAA